MSSDISRRQAIRLAGAAAMATTFFPGAGRQSPVTRKPVRGISWLGVAKEDQIE